jgi:tetratricopeptide (TPR) repeat protein
MDTNIAKKLSDTLLQRNKSALSKPTFYEAIAEWALLALIFLLPLFFLPWTREVLELNKQTILVILTFVAVLAWLGGMVVDKQLVFRSGYLNLLPLLFLLSVFISSLFSLAKYQTWVGQVSQEYTSFLSLVTFVLLFYVLLNSAGKHTFLKRVFFGSLLSTSLVAVIAFLSLFGISPFPYAFAERVGFNTVGSMNALALYMTVMMIFGLAIWLVSGEKDEILPVGAKGTSMKFMIILNTVLAMIFLLAIDFWVFWVLSIVGIMTLFTFSLVQQKDFFAKGTRFSLGFIILLISILFLFVRSPLKLGIAPSVSLSTQTSIHVVRSVFSEGVMKMFFGTGPGTFPFDYLKYKPQTINQTIVWNSVFNQAKSYAITSLATFGIIGTGLFVLFLLFLSGKTLTRLLREHEHENWKFTYVLGVSWLTGTVALFLYGTTITLLFLFWTLSGLLAGQILMNTKETNFGKSPRLGFVFSFLFIFLAVGVITTLFISAKRYAGEIRFAEALNMNRTKAPIEEVIQKLGEAISYNSLSDVYYRNLSYSILLRLRDVVRLPEGATQLTPEQTKLAQQLVRASGNAAGRAIALSPNNVANWTVSGLVYRELISLVRDSNSASASAYTRAAALDPFNPTYPVSIARVHIITADRAKDLKKSENKETAAQAAEIEKQSLSAAEESLNKAIALKDDFAPAHYYLGATYERQGKLKEAIGKLETVRNASPLDIGVGFQLSLLYIRDKNFGAAQKELERIIGLRENYSNARWFLSSVYEQQGNIKSAIEQVEKVLALNPDNKAVSERLDALKSGKRSSVSPSPVEEGEELKERFPDEEEENAVGNEEDTEE